MLARIVLAQLRGGRIYVFRTNDTADLHPERLTTHNVCAMKSSPPLLSYTDVQQELPKTAHLLLGNGFSIGCDKRFQYPNLFSYACKHGLSNRAQTLFERLGTNNFEGVMRLLEDSRWVAKQYGVTDQAVLREMKDDLQTIKNALVEAIAETHLLHTGEVPDKMKQTCAEFLGTYHNIFTTNYDLLLYWVAMAGPESLRTQDGFRPSIDDPDSSYLVFRERVGRNRGMLFLHGALHLYLKDGEVRKHCWERTKTRLTDLVLNGLEEGDYPLFVAEGKPERKRQQIQQSGYLSYCLGKLERIEKAIVVYGHSLGGADEHILNTIADNSAITNVYLGVFGKPDSSSAVAARNAGDRLKRRRKEWVRQTNAKALDVQYYDSATAQVWKKQ